MDHLAEVSARVSEEIAKNSIRDMNILLCELSEDTQLSREDRYTQQQRLRIAVSKHSTEKAQLAEQRRQWLTQGGLIN